MQYYDFAMSATTEELDRIAVEKAGVVASHGYGYETNAVPPLPGGWSGQWVGTKGMGNYGTFVLVGTDARTHALAREGKIRRIQSFGMSHREAVRIHDAHIRFAHESGVLERVSAILACKGATAAMLQHKCCSGRAEGEFFAAHNHILPDFAGLSHPRRCAIHHAVVAATAAA